MLEHDISIEELVELSATDHELYCSSFFPKTVRQSFAHFHHDAWNKLSSQSRLVNLLLFRGAGKTSHCRLFTSKSIAYSLSNTIVYVGKSEGFPVTIHSYFKFHILPLFPSHDPRLTTFALSVFIYLPSST